MSERSDELTKLPEMLAEAQVARWQGKYGRDPTGQQRSWLVNKMQTGTATMGIKLRLLNAAAQVIIRNLRIRSPEHAREPEVTSAHGSAKEDGAGVIRTGPAC